MRCLLRFLTNPTSDVSGNTTVSTSLDLDLLSSLTRRTSLNLMLTLSANGSACPVPQLSTYTSWPAQVSLTTFKLMRVSKQQ